MIISPEMDLQTIVDTAEPGSTLQLGPGEFRCKLLIRTPGLTIRGAGRDATRIVWDDYALKRDRLDQIYVTFRTWTAAVCAGGVSMYDLAIVNDALTPEIKGQEIALTVYANDFYMENCTLSSTQDTLFAGPLPPDLQERYLNLLPEYLRSNISGTQMYKNCLIEGTVDFIFGSGEAVFDSCELHSLYEVRGTSYIAAPSHSIDRTKGFVFRRCTMTAADGVEDGSVYLARPWRDYGTCYFEDCILGAHIAPEGFDKWSGTHRDETARFFESPASEGRVPWINRRRQP